LHLAYGLQICLADPKVNQLDLPKGVTKIAADQHWMNWFLMAVCLVIFIAVFAVMFYSVWAQP